MNRTFRRFRLLSLYALALTALVACTTKIAPLSANRTLVATARAQLVSEGTAVFYPAGFDGGENLPSFALRDEPRTSGPLPPKWAVKPVFSTTGKKSCVTVPIPEGTNLYGTGEAFGGLERSGKTSFLWNTDNYGYAKVYGMQLYQSHPWVLAVRKDGSAFGVLSDSTWRLKLTLEGSIDFESDGPASRVFIIEGKDPQEVMARLASLIGTIELPPLWALGYHQCRYSYYPDAQVREIAQGFRDRDLPCDVIWLDIHYMDGYRVFTFDRNRFPDPSGLNEWLHDNGFKSIWMIDPGVKREPGYAVYDSGTEKDVWVKDAAGLPYVGNVWPGACVFPDFTRQVTRDWWAGLYGDFLAAGIDGVWNDMNEPAVFDGIGGTMPVTNAHLGDADIPAGTHGRYHNAYGLLMTRATREGMLAARPERRPFVLTRANFLGGQRYAATWTGDNAATRSHFEMSVPMSLNLGLSGQPFSGPDIGGYTGNASPDLYADWIALGSLFPFARSHTEVNSLPQEPWAFGSETEEAARTALKRRYRLLPYLYTLFREASVTGMPVMRPVFFADPTDLSLRREDRAFMLGPDLAVVPQWASEPALPKGDWREITLVGENTAEDTHQPILLQRGGSVLPLGEAGRSTEDFDEGELTILALPDGSGKAAGNLYLDDGDGYGYRSGDFAELWIDVDLSGTEPRVTVKRAGGKRAVDARRWKLAIPGAGATRTYQGGEFTLTEE